MKCPSIRSLLTNYCHTKFYWKTDFVLSGIPSFPKWLRLIYPRPIRMTRVCHHCLHPPGASWSGEISAAWVSSLSSKPLSPASLCHQGGPRTLWSVPLCLQRSRWMLRLDQCNHHLNIPSHTTPVSWIFRPSDRWPTLPDHEIVPTNVSANYLSTN